METHLVTDAALTVAVALAAGIVTQSVARHLKFPGIVLLLAAGVLLGPDFWNVVRPRSLGPALQVLVGFAVAVILFEGAPRLRAGQAGTGPGGQEEEGICRSRTRILPHIPPPRCPGMSQM